MLLIIFFFVEYNNYAEDGESYYFMLKKMRNDYDFENNIAHKLHELREEKLSWTKIHKLFPLFKFLYSSDSFLWLLTNHFV